MTDQQWARIVARITANWPHQLPPATALAKWRADLDPQNPEQVEVAVEALYRDGREYPPNGAQILAKLGDLDRDDPDHGEAWNLAMRCVQKFGFYQQVDGLDWLHDQSPAVAKAVETYGYADLCHADLDNENTVRAQFREVYKGVVSRRERESNYSGLPSAGLKGLDRGPKRIGEVVAQIAQGKDRESLG